MQNSQRKMAAPDNVKRVMRSLERALRSAGIRLTWVRTGWSRHGARLHRVELTILENVQFDLCGTCWANWNTNNEER